MPSLNLVSARTSMAPCTSALYEYIVAGNGLFIRAEDARMAACVPVAAAACHGLPDQAAYFRLKLPRVQAAYLQSICRSAFSRLPNESAYQFLFDDGDALPWRCVRPEQATTPTSVRYAEHPDAVIDLHSHGRLAAFWSATDDGDEGGFRIYCVIGDIGTNIPTLRVRAGVYGHYLEIPARAVFEGLGPLFDLFGVEP